MDEVEVLAARMRSGGRLGGGRRRRAARRLADLRSPAAVRELAEAYLSAVDKHVVATAGAALAGLDDPVRVDALCDEVISTGDERLTALVTSAGYQHSDPGRRALLLLLTGEFDRYAELDFDGSVLAGVYALADESLRARLAERARGSARVDWVRVIAAFGKAGRSRLLSDREWAAATDMLVVAGRWDELWRLVADAPPVWAVRMLRELSRREWSPEHDRDTYAELVARAAATPDEVPVGTGFSRLGYLPTATPVRADGRSGFAVSRDGRLVAQVSVGPSVQVWDIASGARVARFTRLPAGPHCLAFTPSGHELVVGGDDGLQLRRIPAGDLGVPDTHESSSVARMAVSPDGSVLATAGSSVSAIGLWRLPGMDPIGVLGADDVGLRPRIRSLVFSPDGSTLASSHGPAMPAFIGEDVHVVRLWTVPDGTRLAELPVDYSAELWFDTAIGPMKGSNCSPLLWRYGDFAAAMPPPPRDFDWNSDHRFAVAGTGGLMAASVPVPGPGMADVPDPGIHLWRLPGGEPAGRLFVAGDDPYGVAVSADGGTVAAAMRTHGIRVWRSDLATLVRTPLSRIDLGEVDRCRGADGDLPGVDAWLDLVAALVRWRRRYDIEVDQPLPYRPTDIEVGE